MSDSEGDAGDAGAADENLGTFPKQASAFRKAFVSILSLLNLSIYDCKLSIIILF